MAGAAELIGRALRGETPLRALAWGALNRVNWLFRTGDRRYEFERLYLDRHDPWDYFSSPYERGKYERTLRAVTAHKPGGASLLEIACSVGAFTELAAPHFSTVTAVDVSSEVLRQARDRNPSPHIEFVRGYVQSLGLKRRFDVITCAEVLCYVREEEADAVCRSLAAHLAPGGLIVYVAEADHAWKRLLANRFEVVSDERVDDSLRPYDLTVLRAA